MKNFSGSVPQHSRVAKVLHWGFILVLLIARFSYMRLTKPTVLAESAPRRIRIASQAVHLGMYLCLAMIPITGLGIGGLYWDCVRSGSLMEGLLLAHEIFVNTGFLLIFAHVAAAFYLRRLGDGV